MIYVLLLSVFVHVIYGAPCGLEGVTITKTVRGDKEYAFVDAEEDIYGAVLWCEGEYMASEEIGFPFGKLLRPTTEELIWVRENVIPDPSVEFNTAYYNRQSQFDFTPDVYGIVSGHGTDPKKHWVIGEPNDHIGVVYSTNRARFDPESNQNIPLFATSLVGVLRPFVCVRTITEAFPANMGYFDKEYECENIVRRDTYGNSREFAFIDQKLTFEEALPMCDSLAKEGFPDSKLSVLDTNSGYHLKRVFAPNEDFWSAHKYSYEYNGYADIYDGGNVIDYYDWDYNQPSGGDCVIATNGDMWLYGAMETTPCSNRHVFACEREVKKVSNIGRVTFNGKEYSIRQGKVLYETAKEICAEEGGKIFQPTKEELLYVLDKLVPGEFQIWLGYDMSWDDYDGVYNSEAFGITEGMYGDSLGHWVKGEPHCIGGITVTTQLRRNPQTGEVLPLLTCSYYQDYYHYVCERDVGGVTRTGGDNKAAEGESTNMYIAAGSFLLGFIALMGVAFVAYRELKPRMNTQITHELTL